MKIDSPKNQHVKAWKKLHTRKEREKTQTFIVEGDHLVEEAVKTLSHQAIQSVILREGEQPNYLAHFPQDKIISVSDAVADDLAETETTQGIFAIVEMADARYPEKVTGSYLFLDAVQDPGNAGTLIRTALAAGYAGVVFGKGSVDPYNEKVLRAAQGAHFHLPIFSGDLSDWIPFIQAQGLTVFGTDLNKNALSYQKVNADGAPYALVVGNEGNGMQADILQLTDINLYIPIAKGAESLNVAIAAGILMFHLG